MEELLKECLLELANEWHERWEASEHTLSSDYSRIENYLESCSAPDILPDLAAKLLTRGVQLPEQRD